jgi:hypothetical protein
VNGILHADEDQPSLDEDALAEGEPDPSRGVKTDLRSHASRSARREDELPMIVKIDLHRVQLRVHDAACSPARRRKPGLHATETRLHREKVGWGHAKDRRIDAGDRPATL